MDRELDGEGAPGGDVEIGGGVDAARRVARQGDVGGLAPVEGDGLCHPGQAEHDTKQGQT